MSDTPMSTAEAVARLNESLTGRYLVEKEIGQGGMATVYLARDVRHDRKVAIKVLLPELAAVLGPERFVTEMKVTANLQHPHILPLFDSGTARSQLFYVMPFVEGESLRDRLNREQQLPIEEAVRITTQVASALDYAHRHGVVHRDIKPENILLHDGSALVADFGIALAVSNAGGTRLTQTGLSLGTPQYMSPEQATGDKNIDGRTDVYSLGCVLYEMLAGEPPFTGPNSQAIVARVLTENVRPIRARRATVSQALEDAVLKAVQRIPGDRFATPAAFVEALKFDGREQRTETREATRAKPSLFSGRGSLLVVAALVGLIAFFVGKRAASSTSGAMSEWTGELLGGPRVALYPRVSPDGQLLAFAAMIDGQTQLAIMKPQSGDWTVCTTDRTKGILQGIAWTPDNSKIYFDRSFELPNGIYSISPLCTDERLVLENAASPEVLPDGSLLVAMVNADRNRQIYHFTPATRTLDTLPAISPGVGIGEFFRLLPGGREAVFFGTPLGQADSVNRLHIVDLISKKIRRVAPGLDLPITGFLPILAYTPDGASIVMNSPVGNASRVVALARDGSNRIQVLTMLTSGVQGLDVSRDGDLYFDQGVRAATLWRYNPIDHRSESWPIPTPLNGGGVILPLPDGRVLAATQTSGGTRVMAITPGKQPQSFMAAEEVTSAPMALVGHDQVALIQGRGDSTGVAIVSIATGQLQSRIPNIHPTDIAGSPDGKTLYYVQAGAVWALPIIGGTAKKIRAGDVVAMDPAGHYLAIEVIAKDQVKLFHVPLDGSAESEIVLHSDFHLAPLGLMAPNAIGPDGRIVVTVVSPASWFWPSGILDPRTGKIEVVPPGLAYDMFGGWDSNGRIVTFALDEQSSLWRFRPVKAAAKKP